MHGVSYTVLPVPKDFHMAWSETSRKQHRHPFDRIESDLTGEEWELIERIPQSASKKGRPRSTDLRSVLDAIQPVLGTGCLWRALPRCFAPFTKIQNSFRLRGRKGVLTRMPDTLGAGARQLAGRFQDPTAATFDCRPVKTTVSGGPAGYDASKKTRGCKRHIATDIGGRPIMIGVHTIDLQDRDSAPAVIRRMLERAPEAAKLWVDGGHQGPKLASKPGALALAVFWRSWRSRRT